MAVNAPASNSEYLVTLMFEPLESFRPLTEFEVLKLIAATPKKFCALDPTPTLIIVGCIETLLPVITKIINLSLQSGTFADQWKRTLVHPLPKKLGLDLVFQSFRPVSNLQYTSKLTEKAVIAQAHDRKQHLPRVSIFVT